MIGFMVGLVIGGFVGVFTMGRLNMKRWTEDDNNGGRG